MDLSFLNIFKDSYQIFINIFIIIFIAFFGWKTLSAIIKKKLDSLENSKDEAQTQRINTLFRILRNFISIAILIIVIMLILSELGIEIGPLIAAAGVVGLAIGFGAQTLVKDIITGLFIILEGQITIGDIVEVAGHSGKVEAITIRTVRLRDINGHLHVIPFSEVTTVKNITQEVIKVLGDSKKHKSLRSRLLKVRKTLGDPGVLDRVAARILEFLRERRQDEKISI